MKNIIKYFYNLKIDNYKKSKSKFIFSIGELNYEFSEYYGNVEILMNLYNTLKLNSIECYEIIKNKENKVITFYENKPYILLKKNKYLLKKDIIGTILEYNSFVIFNGELRWKKLWSSKLDYYIERIYEKDDYNLKHDFFYYSALCEAAINLINSVNIKNIKLGISHVRIERIEDIINPLNFIIDNRVRDLAEYIKDCFFKGKKNDYNILQIIKINKFSNEDIVLFLARLLYPSYFFDEFEFYLNDGICTEKLKKIIKKNSSYEDFLKNVYKDISFYYNIPQIEFLQN